MGLLSRPPPLIWYSNCSNVLIFEIWLLLLKSKRDSIYANNEDDTVFTDLCKAFTWSGYRFSVQLVNQCMSLTVTFCQLNENAGQENLLTQPKCTSWKIYWTD